MAASGDDEKDSAGPSRWMVWLSWGALAYVGFSQVMLRLGGYLPRDLEMYARAGRWWLSGKSPYSEAFIEAGSDTLAFVYSPGSLPLFGPLDALPDVVLSVGWFVAGLAALVWTALYFRRQNAPSTPRVLAVGVVAAFFPAYFGLTYGNIAVVLGPAAVVTHRMVTEPDLMVDVIGGVALGLAVAIKPYWALAFVTPLVLSARWRAVWAVFVGGAVIAVGTLVQPELALNWFQSIHRVDRLYWALLSGPWKVAVDVTLVIGWLGGVGWWWRGGERTREMLFIVALSSVVVWPRVAPYSYIVALPALFAVAGRRGWRHAGIALAGFSSPFVWALLQLELPAVPRLFLYAWTAGFFAYAVAGTRPDARL